MKLDVKLLSKLLFALVKASFKKSLTEFVKDVDVATILDYKGVVKSFIQAQHKVPGEVRKLLCKQIDNITAKTMNEIKSKIMEWVDSI